MELDGPGFLTVLGGFLLVLPGFLTDMIGALLLLPITRTLDSCDVASRRGARRARRADGRRWSTSSPDQWRQVPEERIGRKPSDTASELSLIRRVLVAPVRLC